MHDLIEDKWHTHWYILGATESILGLRFILKALGANPGSPIASFVYGLSEPFVSPFVNLFRNSVNERFIVEWSTLFGMLAYLLLAWAVVNLLQFIKPASPREVERTLRKT